MATEVGSTTANPQIKITPQKTEWTVSCRAYSTFRKAARIGLFLLLGASAITITLHYTYLHIDALLYTSYAVGGLCIVSIIATFVQKKMTRQAAEALCIFEDHSTIDWNENLCIKAVQKLARVRFQKIGFMIKESSQSAIFFQFGDGRFQRVHYKDYPPGSLAFFIISRDEKASNIDKDGHYVEMIASAQAGVRDYLNRGNIMIGLTPKESELLLTNAEFPQRIRKILT